MRNFRITKMIDKAVTYEVEANNVQEAEDKIVKGKVKPVDDDELFVGWDWEIIEEESNESNQR